MAGVPLPRPSVFPGSALALHAVEPNRNLSLHFWQWNGSFTRNKLRLCKQK